MRHLPYCLECERLAIEYQRTIAEHSDFVAEHGAAIQARDLGKIRELKSAVIGSELFCRKAREKLSAHQVTHRQNVA